jgi:hypothetical protein
MPANVRVGLAVVVDTQAVEGEEEVVGGDPKEGAYIISERGDDSAFETVKRSSG